MHAIIIAKEICIKWPKTSSEIQEKANAFKKISTKGILSGCVGTIDGILIPIKVPSRKETGHVKNYFSGYYHCYGVNVQACADADCCFTFLSAASPGGVNDLIAVRKSGLMELINNLLLLMYVVGDNAYVYAEHILTPFSGHAR